MLHGHAAYKGGNDHEAKKPEDDVSQNKFQIKCFFHKCLAAYHR